MENERHAALPAAAVGIVRYVKSLRAAARDPEGPAEAAGRL